MNLKPLQKCLKHPVYLVTCVSLGLLFWMLAFKSEAQIKSEAQKRIPQSLHKDFQVLQLSSVKEINRELENTEYRALKNISDIDLKSKLIRNKNMWLNSKENHAVSLSNLKFLDRQVNKEIPKRFENNPVFKILEQMTTQKTISTDYEDLIVCDKSRQFYEEKIVNNRSVLKELLTNRMPASGELTPNCLIHSMRKYQPASNNFAACTKSSGTPTIPGGKPCVTPNLVNLTYNSFMDVTQCLNLNPKDLMAEIDIESGFFLNAYGQEKETGIGQLSRSDIEEVDMQLDHYLGEIQKAAGTKKSCANILKFKDYLTKVSSKNDQRCSLVAVPENPLRNIFYKAVLNRINLEALAGIKYVAGQDYLEQKNNLVPVLNTAADEFEGFFKKYEIKEKLEKVGMANPDLHYFKKVMILLANKTGAESAVKLLSSYLQQRISAKLPTGWAQFDFTYEEPKEDLDGKIKSAIEVARSYVFSAFIDPKDSDDIKAMKVIKRKELPKVWAMAFTESFPVYLTLRNNSYNGQTLDPFSIYGYPGFLSAVADRNKSIREAFNEAELDPNACVDSSFLKPPEQ